MELILAQKPDYTPILWFDYLAIARLNVVEQHRPPRRLIKATLTKNIAQSTGKPFARSPVDIRSHHALCEMNYHRLLKLMPNNEAQDCWRIGIEEANQKEQLKQTPVTNKRDVTITVIDSAPYTTTVELEQESFLALLKKPKVLVRLYHDATMAEIVGWDGYKNWHPHYLYPNDKMYQPDEKLSLNRFLSDWLAFCCKHGHFIDNKCDGVLVNTK